MNGYVQSLLGILISTILTENFILVKFYGICPFMGVSKKIDTALGMGYGGDLRYGAGLRRLLGCQ